MTLFGRASAPAKLILCGEHAVVYQQPAIAVPLAKVRAEAEVQPAAAGTGLHFEAPDLGRSWVSDGAEEPLGMLVAALRERYGLPPDDLLITLRSQIPIASGMGSGAAIATALVRAFGLAYRLDLAPAEISALVYDSERHFHGTPSGIDNTVVAFERPIWFQRRPQGLPLVEPLELGAHLRLLVADSGVRSATKLPVGAVREGWQRDRSRYESLFAAIGALVEQARLALAQGDIIRLGELLNHNHDLLCALGVSSPELDRLVQAAQQAGALGAKLSGAGWGGVMLVLVTPEQAAQVRAALCEAGAVNVFGG